MSLLAGVSHCQSLLWGNLKRMNNNPSPLGKTRLLGEAEVEANKTQEEVVAIEVPVGCKHAPSSKIRAPNPKSMESMKRLRKLLQRNSKLRTSFHLLNLSLLGSTQMTYLRRP